MEWIETRGENYQDISRGKTDAQKLPAKTICSLSLPSQKRQIDSNGYTQKLDVIKPSSPLRETSRFQKKI